MRLTHTGPITIADFNFVNASGHLSGARIQGIGMDDNASGFVTAIPEPSTYAAMLGGVALLFAVVRKRLLAARVAAAAA